MGTAELRAREEVAPAIARRRRLLVVGPTPPPHHGVAVYTDLLLRAPELHAALDVVHLDTADRRTLENLGRFDLTNAGLALAHAGKLARLVLRVRPDAVYLPISRNRWGYLRDALLIAVARLGGARVITHLHGSDLRGFMDESSAPLRALIRWSSARLDAAAVLAPCLKPLYGDLLPGERVGVVPPAIEDPFPAGVPARARDAHTPVTVAYLGSLFEPKGYLDLLRAVASLRATEPEIRVALAGDWTSADERRRARQLIERLELESRVHFAGVVEGAGKRQFLEAADLLVFPGWQPEGLPLVVLEAMAAGLPVIATPTGAIPDAVVQGETGYLVPAREPDALARRIAELAADPALRERLGAAGRQRYLQAYTAAHAARALQALVERVCPA